MKNWLALLLWLLASPVLAQYAPVVSWTPGEVVARPPIITSQPADS